MTDIIEKLRDGLDKGVLTPFGEQCREAANEIELLRKQVGGKQVGGTHYQKTIQPWDAMEAWMSREQFIGYLRGNAIKYLARCDDKGGLEDLQKAQHYLAKLIEVESR